MAMLRYRRLCATALLCAGLAAAPAAPDDAVPVQLRVNDVDEPLGLDARDVACLRFSWVIDGRRRDIRQSACRILVASAPRLLDADTGDLWDSGKTPSPRQNGIVYAGKPLAGKTAYWWKAKIWDGENREDPWSKPACFETGIVDARKDWTGSYVGGPGPKKDDQGNFTANQFNLMRREFDLPAGKAVARARAYVAAEVFPLCLWDFRVNGRRVDDTVVLRQGYFTFDVTRLLKAGSANAVGVLFGDTGLPRRNMRPKEWGSHNLWLCDVDVWFADGTRQTVGTDGSCKGFQGGPVTDADIADGEDYDARKEAAVAGWDRPGFQDAGWTAVQKHNRGRPDGGHQRDAVRVHQTLPAAAMTKPRPGAHLFDFGRNISGWVQITVKGPAGTVLVLRHAERVKADGSLDRSSNLSGMPAQQTDRYTLRGGSVETWEPSLTWHGFRYVEIEGPVELTAESVKARWIHSDILRRAAAFDCSDPLLVRLFDAFRTGELDNSIYLHLGCNQRDERAPWSADSYACTAASLALFDSANFWQYWIRIANRSVGPHDEGGNLCMESHGFALLWQAHCTLIPWDYHLATGDEACLAPAYERSRRFADCLVDWFDCLDEVVWDRKKNRVASSTSRDDYLIEAVKPWKDTDGKDADNMLKYWGDWCHPRDWTLPNGSALTSMYYYHCLDLVAREAALLGRTEDAAKYSAMAAKVRDAVNGHFLAPNGNRFYGKNGQTLNALALSIGIVPEAHRAAVAQSLAEDVWKRDHHLDTGVVGAMHLLRALTEAGHDDAALALARQTTFPSWGYMLQAPGAPGTFWEHWDNRDWSKNHPFLGGGLASWLLESVGGVRPIEPGYAVIEYKPGAAVVKSLDHARASVPTVRGEAAISWRRDGSRLAMDVTVPVNATARIVIPAAAASATISEGGTPLWKGGAYRAGVAGITLARAADGGVVVEAGSGRYRFAAE